jgi:hypothetical protein
MLGVRDTITPCAHLPEPIPFTAAGQRWRTPGLPPIGGFRQHGIRSRRSIWIAESSTAGVHIFPSTQLGLVVNFAVHRKSLISTRGTLRV